MKIIVTGGAGFVASHAVDKLIAKGHDVIVIDNLTNSSEANINPKAKLVQKSILDNLSSEFHGIDVVIHHAANVFVTKSIEDPVFDAQINIMGSLNILEHCRKAGVKKIIYANSGGAAAGENSRIVTESSLIKPLCPYGVSKHTVEHYLFVYNLLYGLKYTSLRYANIYGPRQNPRAEGGVVAIFIDKMLNNEQPVIYGNGGQTRDLVYVEDVADANMLALTKADNQCINIGTGKDTSVNQLFKTLKKILEYKKEPIYKPARKGEIIRSVLSPRKAKSLLGWVPKHTLEQGLKKTVDYYRQS
ncbi:MAG: NAD-dependent epimerase/dehydratase family protein [Candidatus Aenigmarchaeota archaeon]|nr:NAD-dependent epimerase/dehydratase family protein [Candidatus Aenigmarchaeota archaeon]